jgi:hypothetical protein
VSADLRHHSAGGDDLRRTRQYAIGPETYAAMISCRDPGNGRVLRTLDDLRLRLEAAALTLTVPCTKWKSA